MKNLTFKMKLYFFAILIGFIPILIVSLITTSQASKALETAIFRSNEVYFENAKKSVSSYFDDREGNAKEVATSRNVIDALTDPNYSIQEDDFLYFGEVAKTFGYALIGILDTKGNVVIANSESIIGANFKSLEYIDNTLSGEATWTEIYLSPTLNANIISFGYPIKHDGEIIGAIAIVIPQININKLIHEGIKTLGESGDAYMVDEELMLQTETLLGDYTENAALLYAVESEGTINLASALKSENYDYTEINIYKDYLNSDVLGANGIIDFGDTHLGLVIEVDVAEAMKPVANLKILTYIILMIVVILVIVITFFLIKIIVRPVKLINVMLKDISEGEGDLTKRLHITTKDEFGELGQLFNNFIIKLQDLVGGIAINATTLAASSTEISASVDNSNQSLESINSKTTDINVSITNNASVLEETNASLEEIASSANLISEKADEVSGFSTDALEATKIGSANLEIANESVLKVQDSSNEMEEVIKNLNASSNEIGGIISIITGISEQTNLLALNAAIEAARAGEQGRGFAVVADEVRKLAEETKVSAENITKLVGSLISESNRALKSVENEKIQVSESVENINKTSYEFISILEKISSVAGLMDNISAMVSTQTAVTDDIALAISEITTSTVESATSINDITANIQSQAAMFEEITASVEELSSTAETLQSETNNFVV